MTRDWEHFRGVPVSKRIGARGIWEQSSVSRAPGRLGTDEVESDAEGRSRLRTGRRRCQVCV